MSTEPLVAHYKAGSYLPITEPWLYNQIVNLRKFTPVVYCHGIENLELFPTESVRSLGIKRVGGGPWTFMNKAWIRVFKRHPAIYLYARKDGPDIVHAHFGPSGYYFLKYKRKLGVPMVTTFYGLDVNMFPLQNPGWKKLYRDLFREGECFLAEGPFMKKQIVGLGCPEDKVIVQHIGIDLNAVDFSERKVGDDGEVKVLVSAGFREKKGIPYAVEAFCMVRRRSPELRMKLTIIGGSPGNREGEEEKAKILGIIERYRAQEDVDMLGFLPYADLIDRMRYHHVFLSPSVSAASGDNEGGAPVSIIEASASGMPVLSTQHCDIPEVIVDGETGLLVPEKDVEKLADKLEYLVRNSWVFMEMGRRGREHIARGFDVKRQVETLEDIYSRLLAGR